MCNPDCMTFGRQSLGPEEIRGKRVLEVGSYDVNGSLREVIEAMAPAEYIGIDMEMGKGVDVVCAAEEIRERFGEESFDAVVSTEMIEHVFNWRKVVSNLKNICRPGGVVLITTRSMGFEYHGWPNDYWRFEPEDMTKIFSDFDIERIAADDSAPGVFLKARKPIGFRENDLSSIALFSVVEGRRTMELCGKDLESFLQRNRSAYDDIFRGSLRAKAGKAWRDISWMVRRRKYRNLLEYASVLLRGLR